MWQAVAKGLLLIAWMLGMAMPAAASEPTKSLTVVLDDSYPPYIFRGADGQFQGILVDFWRLWEARTGVQAVLKPMDWARAQQVLQAGQADVIDTLFLTEARRGTYEFSKPYARLDVSIFFHKSISGIVNAASLKGFTVGVKDGDACVDHLASAGITNLRRFAGYESLIHAATLNEIRIFCIDEPPAFYLLHQAGVERDFRHSAPLYVGEFHRAVRKGNSEVLRLVEDGYARITADEREAIHRKWFGAALSEPMLPAYATYAISLLLILGLIAAGLFAINRNLQRRVARKTSELTAALLELSEAKQHSEQTLDKLSATLEAIPDLLFELDGDGRYLDFRASREDMLAAPPEQFIGRNVMQVLPKEAAVAVLAALREAEARGSSHGTLIRISVPAGDHWFELSVSRKKVPEGEKPRFILLSRNVTERKQAEAEIERLAFFDTLTQLPNRRLLIERLRQALAASMRRDRHGALLFIDLDDFKTLNDTKGHNTGDLLLKQVALRLQSCVRIEDSVARLGGDEFVVMLEDLSGDAKEAAQQAEFVGEKILAVLCAPYQLEAFDYHTTASIGISLFSGYAESEDELLKRADAAMYRAKTAGRNTVRFFDPVMQATLEARATLETELRRGLPEKQLQLYYQPQIDMNGRIFGAEALLRWWHPERGLVSPAQFIPLAEETGLIVPIGQWVLEVACDLLKHWEARPETRSLQLSINVSARQFRQADFVAQVRRTVEASDINPARLKLELTESLVLDNVADSIEKMHQLKSCGISFSMDDFGTGYSSLSYLKRLPLDQLKIDQSFVRDIATDQGDAVIVQTIIGMASNLGLNVIAEGVETEDQRAFLIQHGCLAFQGYLFGKPVPLQEFEARLGSESN